MPSSRIAGVRSAPQVAGHRCRLLTRYVSSRVRKASGIVVGADTLPPCATMVSSTRLADASSRGRPRRRPSSITASSGLRPLLCSMARSSASACATVRGKPSRMKPRCASASIDAVGHDADDDLVRDEPAGSHHVLGLQPDRGSGRDRGTQHVARREVAGCRDVAIRRAACVPFPAPGGPRKIRILHRFFPLSRDFLISPSY